jgi:hypothetical protein
LSAHSLRRSEEGLYHVYVGNLPGERADTLRPKGSGFLLERTNLCLIANRSPVARSPGGGEPAEKATGTTSSTFLGSGKRSPRVTGVL